LGQREAPNLCGGELREPLDFWRDHWKKDEDERMATWPMALEGILVAALWNFQFCDHS
jgi:hypothetical protein